MTQQQASVVKLLVPYLLMGEHLPDDILQMGQVAHFLITEGVLFRQTRKEFKKAGPVDAILWTGLEEVIGAALRR
jgi:hypothetical protein